MVYKWCVVPQCTNTSTKSPHKFFVSVPTTPKRRKMWLQLARRDPKSILSHTNVFMCEDHFDMEKDVKNYMQYKSGYSQKLLLADVAAPTKFYCQEDRKRRLSDAGSSREVFLKRQRTDLVTECLQHQSTIKAHRESLQNYENTIQEITESEELQKTQDKETITETILTVDKSVQVTSKVYMHYRSKAVQTRNQQESVSTSPFKVYATSRFTSPIKFKPCSCQQSQSVVNAVGRNIILDHEKSDSAISCFGSGYSSPFVATSSSRVTDTDSIITDTNENIEKLQCLKNTMRVIAKKPLMYVGISKECYFLIQLLHKHTNIKIEYIFLCLKKIRLNSTFSELKDNFGISLSYASKLFLGNIPTISSFLKPFIFSLDKKLIKKNLPITFRHNYHNVSCIIDCLEINIQKPSKAVHQALTWSEYKKVNTLKYLISCTPNGLVNYVSQGFGRRTSDVTIVENFLDGLQQGTCILADRGFKHIEQIVQEKGMKLLRPPSINSDAKLTKTEVRQTKIIASLQIHIERVIRQLREFHMLKQHSVINTNILRVLDHVIIIACALINLQFSLI